MQHAVSAAAVVAVCAALDVHGQDFRLLYSFESELEPVPFATESFGWSVSGTGDVNNDGFSDILVGARFANVNGSDSGSAFVYSGKTGEVIYSKHGRHVDAWFGNSVSGAGDVDRDGYSDFAVGSQRDNTKGADSGSVSIYSGRTGNLLHEAFGQSAGDAFGFDIDGVGDVNGDGYDDVLVGAPGSSVNGRDSGQAVVLSGETGERLITINGSDGSDFGWSVSGLGNAAPDSTPDFVVGSPSFDGPLRNSGRAQVFLGSEGGSDLGREHRALGGSSFEGRFGTEVSGLGDVDGDGWSDFIVGANRQNTSIDDPGTVTVFSGLTGQVIYEINGADVGETIGTAVSGVGDINNDGVPDFVIGAPGEDSRTDDGGKIIIISGSDASLLGEIETLVGGDLFGFSIDGAGDINGDGIGDFVVSAPRGGDRRNGRVYVFSGIPSPSTLTVLVAGSLVGLRRRRV